jgi:hypothetical protein
MNIHLYENAAFKISEDIETIRGISGNMYFSDAVIKFLEKCLAECDDGDKGDDDE